MLCLGLEMSDLEGHRSWSWMRSSISWQARLGGNGRCSRSGEITGQKASHKEGSFASVLTRQLHWVSVQPLPHEIPAEATRDWGWWARWPVGTRRSSPYYLLLSPWRPPAQDRTLFWVLWKLRGIGSWPAQDYLLNRWRGRKETALALLCSWWRKNKVTYPRSPKLFVAEPQTNFICPELQSNALAIKLFFPRPVPTVLEI